MNSTILKAIEEYIIDGYNKSDGYNRQKIFVLKENNAEYRATNINGKNMCSFQIDGGLIKDGKRCDKGLFIEAFRIFLIELKGCDLNSACKQLLETYKTIKRMFKETDVFCRAVVQKMPSKINYPASYRLLKSTLPKKDEYFKYKSQKMEENIE